MKPTANILMLGGAKRVSMARRFIEAADSLGITLHLFSYELTREVPVSIVADIVTGRRWNDPELLEHLHTTVMQHRIDIMIPFVDGAVGAIARYMLRYGDVWAPVGSLQMSELMFDKIAAANIFEENGIDIPRTYHKGAPRFPLIAKPRYGSASKGISVLRNTTDFRKIKTAGGEYLLQEYIAHSREYTVDCYVTQSGDIICAVPRQRLEVTGGEVSRTVTVRSQLIESTARMVLRRLGLKGAITIQFIEDTDTGRLYLMEINPRLGGGAVCAVAAGADLPRYILSEYAGLPLTPCDDWRGGTEIARYFSEVTFHHDEK